ncbi:GNAT family N-acetyltransferase [Saliterribacillus persicus]|uniref:RimJ/RimL family protein N-acetyltransferase n=1 Tax=Saliterribacillus persicus TaxID=930114 RepID=A0A368XGG5_9BACI|nr:GNAT family protein [Saliterribacillus persicus]RCW66286.1 RimJ/RimL family protein N-acetyltransferase [Saliterribacillus persicus]
MIEINGEKIVLTEVTDQDIDTLYYWKYEDKQQEAKKWNGPYTPEEEITKEMYRQNWNHDIFPHVPSSLVIRCDGKAIGYVGCYWVDKNTNWLETGIVIYDFNYWNGGYGTQAYKLWIDYLFKVTDIHRLGMSTWSGNIRMIKVAAKLGMKEEARIREARIINGEFFDAIKMGILRREWK